MRYSQRFFSRGRRSLLLAFSVVLACGLLGTTVAVTTARPASAAPNITICLKNARQFCVAVKDSRNVSGQPLWLHSTRGGRDYHWYEVPVPCATACQPGCNFASCIAFEDVQKPSLCLAATARQGTALRACQLGIGGTPLATWIQNGTHLRNIFWGEDLSTASPLRNGGPIALARTGTPRTWQQWTGP